MTAEQWDEFCSWCRRFVEWPGFADSERGYKLEIASNMVTARDALTKGHADWVQKLRVALGRPNNIANPQWVVRPFLTWVVENNDEARDALRLIWADDEDLADRVTRFCALLPETVAGPGNRLSLASVLLFACGVEDHAAFRTTSLNRCYELTGFPAESGGPEGDRYAQALRFLDTVIEECRTRGIEVGDRLDAQSLTWSITSYAPEDWPEADRQSLLLYAAGVAMTDLLELVEEFRASTGYPDESDHRRTQELEELRAGLTQEALVEPDADLFRRVAAGAYGSPGPQSTFMSVLSEDDGPDRVAALVADLLYGEGTVAERIDLALQGEKAIKGLKEALITKFLALQYPEEWIPAYVTTGPYGKRAMIDTLGLPPIKESLTRGEQAVASNDRLLAGLAPIFGADVWGMLRFGMWAVTHQEREAEPDSLARVAHDLYMDEEFLELIETLLEDRGQVIFQGPPGTGKTYVARLLAEYFSRAGGTVTTVQFHPSYAYEDFVEGYRPALVKGQPGFQLEDGPLKEVAAAAAERPDARHVLIIDEINRGNVAKILGELYYLLEYRDDEMQLQYSKQPFRIPKNVWLIGTMNTADRSIALIDSALRRRFHFIDFYPDEPPISGVLAAWLERNKPELMWLVDVVDRANALLADREMAIGPSHFIAKGDRLDEKWIDLIWQHSVLPYIREQHYGSEDRLDAYDLDRLRGEAPGSVDLAVLAGRRDFKVPLDLHIPSVVDQLGGRATLQEVVETKTEHSTDENGDHQPPSDGAIRNRAEGVASPVPGLLTEGSDGELHDPTKLPDGVISRAFVRAPD